VRAAYAALVVGLIGGLALATAVLSSRGDRPLTVAAALRIDRPAGELEGRRSEAVAALVAQCMARHGLRWTAVAEPAPPIPDPDLGPVDWAKRWGFGVSTTVGTPPVVTGLDPNMAGLEAVDPALRDVYRRALHGDGPVPGCHATATDSVFGLRDRLLAPLRPALEALDARIAADPAAARAVAAWRACVAPVAGGLAVDRRVLPGALVERFAARVRSVVPGPSSVAGLAALQADERRVATAVAECELAYARGRTAAAASHEAAFVAEHRQALEGIGAAIRAAEAALPTLPP
jgi:hypothetical protein